MIMQMRLQDLRPRFRYEKLQREEDYDDDNTEMMNAPMKVVVASPRRRCFWVKKMNGKVTIRGVKISRCKRVNWKRFSLLAFPRKFARIYSEVVKRLIELDGSSIIFATTWGIPVISNL